ncbi:MAG: hypothetical protein RL757_3085 [Bacteroidota bacterium]
MKWGRLKKYQHRTWKTNFEENKNIFLQKYRKKATPQYISHFWGVDTGG